MENEEINELLSKHIDDEIIKGIRKAQINSLKTIGNYNKETSYKYVLTDGTILPKDYFKPFIIDLA